MALSCTAASLNMAAAARTVSEAKRSVVLGIVSAGGSLGTLVTAPVAQALMDGPAGWQGAMLALFGMALVMVPAALFAIGNHVERCALLFVGPELDRIVRAFGKQFRR